VGERDRVPRRTWWLATAGVLLLIVVVEWLSLRTGARGEQLHVVAVTVHGMGASFVAVMLASGMYVGVIPRVGTLSAAAVTLSVGAVGYLAGVTLGTPERTLIPLLLGSWLLGAAGSAVGLRLPGGRPRAGPSAWAGTAAFVLGVVTGLHLLVLPTPVRVLGPHLRGEGAADAWSATQLVAVLAIAAAVSSVAAVHAWRLVRAQPTPWLTSFACALLLGATSLLQRFVAVVSPAWSGRPGGAAAELLWLLSGAVLLVAALQGLRAHSGAVSAAREAERRRRIADELHDGLAQDLALVASHGAVLARRVPDHAAELGLVVAASTNALAASRAAIDALLDGPAEVSDDDRHSDDGRVGR
jgi:signal transduction histidine kinase